MTDSPELAAIRARHALRQEWTDMSTLLQMLDEAREELAKYRGLKDNPNERHCQACIGELCTATTGCVALSNFKE